ncbi:hypothetical protein CO613_08125 [Lysobacteraceae bacterium NML07-0707]|nr:hypothetical protein CO613_08125 [Xanthomonadaceae bacterium NML07-0707]
MENLLNFIDIPAADFDRAVDFYQAVLGKPVHKAKVGDDLMGFFPQDGQNVAGAICHGERWQPSAQGVLVYLNGGADLQVMLDKVASHGGQVLLPKTHISPEVGYIAIFLDSEGNRMALHSLG